MKWQKKLQNTYLNNNLYPNYMKSFYNSIIKNKNNLLNYSAKDVNQRACMESK